MIFILFIYYKMFTLTSDLYREENSYLSLEICDVFRVIYKPLNTYDNFYIYTLKIM